MRKTAHGPDISHYQTITGPFDPSWLLGSTKVTQGANYKDPTRFTSAEWMKPARYRGGYHWLEPDRSVAAQVNWFLACLPFDLAERGNMGQLDWEVTKGKTVATSGMATEFVDRVHQRVGRECMITYAAPWLPDSTLDDDLHPEFYEWRDANPTAPLWLADYSAGSAAHADRWDADVLQWTSKYHHPSLKTFDRNGVDTGFDMNRIRKAATLERLCGYLTIPPPEIIDPPTPEADMPAITPPQRLCDTREPGRHPLQGGEQFSLDGIMAKQATVNLTVVSPTADGYLVAWGKGGKPHTSNVQFTAGHNADNAAVVELDAGTLHVEARSSSGKPLTCHLIVDLQAAC